MKFWDHIFFRLKIEIILYAYLYSPVQIASQTITKTLLARKHRKMAEDKCNAKGRKSLTYHPKLQTPTPNEIQKETHLPAYTRKKSLRLSK
jgi:hypothetical protein